MVRLGRAIKVVASVAAGATVGFLVAGPPGAATFGIASAAASIKHDGIVIGGNLNIPAPASQSIPQEWRELARSNNTVTETGPNIKHNDFYHQLTELEKGEGTNNEAESSLTNKSESTLESKIGNKVIDGVAGTVNFFDRLSQLEAGHVPGTGPILWTIHPDDPINIKLMKEQCNSLTKLIDNAPDIGPTVSLDLAAGPAVTILGKKIREYEEKREREKYKDVCPKCQGTKTVSKTVSNIVGNIVGKVGINTATMMSVETIQSDEQVGMTRAIESFEEVPCDNCSGTGTCCY